MSTKVQVTRPTKIELARLKRRLRLAKRIQKIVKDRLSILVMEFLQNVRECVTVKERLVAEFNEAYKALTLTTGYHGAADLERELMIAESDISVFPGSRNVAGVWIPLFEIEKADHPQVRPRSPVEMSAVMAHNAALARQCLETAVQLAELERSLELLGTEINKVKRINNALEYMVIPGLDVTIKYLTMKFEERDREEGARLKYVKLLIEKREAYAY